MPPPLSSDYGTICGSRKSLRTQAAVVTLTFKSKQILGTHGIITMSCMRHSRESGAARSSSPELKMRMTGRRFSRFHAYATTTSRLHYPRTCRLPLLERKCFISGSALDVWSPFEVSAESLSCNTASYGSNCWKACGKGRMRCRCSRAPNACIVSVSSFGRSQMTSASTRSSQV